MQDPSTSSEYYKQIAGHFASTRDYRLAEEHYVKAGMSQEAVAMYVQADRWEEAHRLAVGCMEEEQVRELFVGRAQELEGDGKLREAEKLYVIVGEADLAVSMYKRHKQVRKGVTSS